MDAAAILEKLHGIGVRVTPVDDQLLLKPGSKVPHDLLEEIKQHKQELLFKLKGPPLKYPEGPATKQELEEIADTVHTEGYILLWSTVLKDLVAFYKTEADRKRIPPEFVPYSDQELWELFGEGKTTPSPGTLKLIHEAKKHGGRVISSEPGYSKEGT